MKSSLTLALVLASVIAYAQSSDYAEKKNAQFARPSPFIGELSGQAKDRIIYESNQVLAFDTNKPQAPVHIIVMPKQRIATLNDLKSSDSALVREMIFTATKLAASNGVAETGYQFVFNTHEHAEQSAFHTHLHLLGGVSTDLMVDQYRRK